MNKYTELNTVQVLKTKPYIVIAMAFNLWVSFSLGNE